MAGSDPLPEEDEAAIREAAAEWIIALDEAPPEHAERLRAACEAWQAEDPRRRRVFAQISQLWAAPRARARRRRQRRRITGLSVFALLALGLTSLLPWSNWLADERTAVGEIRTVRLPDGSTMVLDTATAVDVRFGPQQRLLELHSGAIYLDVRPEPAGRPLSVATDHGRATALGTAFTVALRDAGTHVAVHQARVSVAPTTAPQRAQVLDAGEAARVTAASVERGDGRRQPPDWASQRLIFRDAPIALVADRLAAYRPGWPLIDPALNERDLRFTGVLPAEDSDAALRLLTQSLELRTQRLTPFLVRLTERE